MKIPNVLSAGILLALVTFLEYLAAGADQLVPTLWVPVVVLLLTAGAKALQVYIQSQPSSEARALDKAPQSPVRRWLLD